MNKTTHIKKLVTATLATVALALCAPAAHATLILTLTDNVTLATVTIADNQLGLDSDTATGSISYSGGIIGSSWSAFLTTGGSNAPGTSSIAFLDFSSIFLRNAGAGSLTLTLTDDGFTNPAGTNMGASTGIGGTTTGTVTAFSLFNGNSLINLGSFTAGAGNSFSGGGRSSVDTTNPNPFSLTNSVTVSYGPDGGQSTFAMNTSVPEPATLGLLGLGLMGLGLVRRKFARRQPTKV